MTEPAPAASTASSATPASSGTAPGASGGDLPWEGAPAAQLEKNLDRMHASAGDTREAAVDTQAPNAGGYEEPDDAEVEEALAHVRGLPHAAIVKSALRFSDSKHALVQLFPNMVIGHGPRGLALVPWNGNCLGVHALPAEGIVVDGVALHRALKASANDVEITVAGTGASVLVSSSNGRFKVKTIQGHTPPTVAWPAADAYKPFDPAMFRVAAKFVGGDKVNPPQLNGVHLGAWLESTDRSSLFCSTGSLAGFDVTLPNDAFDDIGGQCFVAVAPSGNVFIADPATGQYRMVIPWTGDFPKVRDVAYSMPTAFVVEVDSGVFVETLKRCTVVQKKTAPLRLWLMQNAEGTFLELRAGGRDNDYMRRIPATLHSQQPLAAMVKLSFPLAHLERLAAISPSPTSVPLLFASHEAQGYYYVGIETQTMRALVCPMEAE